MKSPKWLVQLPEDERKKAEAILAFMDFHANSMSYTDAQFERFVTLVEDIEWPQSGALPTVSRSTARKLGIHKDEWKTWRKPLRFGFVKDLLDRLPNKLRKEKLLVVDF